MKKSILKIGYCPTQREVFSREAAIEYRKKIKERISKFDIEIIDIEDIAAHGLLYELRDKDAIIKRFKENEVDALFFPHCNFGSENLVAEIAAEFKKPTLLWGPRDDMPDKNGFRNRDSQCGMFATGKSLRRCNVNFTYIPNIRLEDKRFEIEFDKFLRTANVVKAMTNLRILQISTRPMPFGCVTCNEGELVEKFGIRIAPVTLQDVKKEVEAVKNENGTELSETAKFISAHSTEGNLNEQILLVAALKVAIKRLCEKFGCRTAAIQCWDSLQDIFEIMPCLANSLLTDEGIPVACETDIHGAITAVMAQAATLDIEPQFFADLTIRHPENDNAELLWHCGNFPYSLAKNKEGATVGRNLYNADKCFGICEWELKEGHLTVLRFDGDKGEYRLFIGEGDTVEGPKNVASYVWIEVSDWEKWERKFVEGPYIHHVSSVYGSYSDVFKEACKYIDNLSADYTE